MATFCRMWGKSGHDTIYEFVNGKFSDFFCVFVIGKVTCSNNESPGVKSLSESGWLDSIECLNFIAI